MASRRKIGKQSKFLVYFSFSSKSKQSYFMPDLMQIFPYHQERSLRKTLIINASETFSYHQILYLSKTSSSSPFYTQILLMG